VSARVLLVDNHDSFTWNIAHVFAELGAHVDVVDVERVSVNDVCAAPPTLVVIGPGPRGPADLPALTHVVTAFTGRIPLFGVCLGLQALVLAFGGTVSRARRPLHGKTCVVEHDDTSIFRGLPNRFRAMRYNSLVATSVPAAFRVTAVDDDGQVMAIADDARRVCAVQFHPESIGTEGGRELCAAALTAAGGTAHVVFRPGSIPPPARATDSARDVVRTVLAVASSSQKRT
jgi:anthranilate synthase/aminodeoxychorismate synthase-like glutamine amidotransferase